MRRIYVPVPLKFMSRMDEEVNVPYNNREAISKMVLHAFDNISEADFDLPFPDVEAPNMEIEININGIENLAIKELLESYEEHLIQMKEMNKKPMMPNPYKQIRKLIYYRWAEWPMFNPNHYEGKHPMLFNREEYQRIMVRYNTIKGANSASRYRPDAAEAKDKWLAYCDQLLLGEHMDQSSFEFRKLAVEYWDEQCKSKPEDNNSIILETYYGKYTNNQLRQKARKIVQRDPMFNQFGDYKTASGRLAIVKEYDRQKAEKEYKKTSDAINKATRGGYAGG